MVGVHGTYSDRACINYSSLGGIHVWNRSVDSHLMTKFTCENLIKI